MERRAALAVGISLLILYFYQAFVLKPVQPPADANKPAASSSAPAASSGTNSAAALEASPPVPAPEAVVADTTEHTVIVDTGKVQAVISNRGGRILNWRLTGYRDDKGASLDLVPSNVPAEQPRPLSLDLKDAVLSKRANTSLYKVSGDVNGRVDARQAAQTVTFEFQDASGFHVRKELRFEPRSYIFSVKAQVLQDTRVVPAAIQWGPGLGDQGSVAISGGFLTGNVVQPPSAIFNLDAKVTRVVAEKTTGDPVHEGRFLFAGIDDHYFLAAAVDPGPARIEYQPVTVSGPGETRRVFLAQSITQTGENRSLRFFVGPKELETLRAAGINGELAYAINYGMFKWIVIPLLGALKWVYGFIGNYGWSIVCLTIIINLVMFPLRHKSLVSMRKMQALQPQIKSIQDRYADLKVTDPDRQKMNTEIMNLYREKGVNPASGCVPMLLTMPVLFAFYSMLSQSIELRGADFGFWIHDLSLKDPYYVTPLLMGATMFLQQWMTPTSVDPAQQKMMMFMPLVLTAVFLRLPSGLAIYYLVSNLCQIGQQYVTNRTIGAPPAAQPPLRSAAGERRLKSAGGGKSAGAAGLKQGERRA
jgi:YidC/Oxa1 family membrane protein insertase